MKLFPARLRLLVTLAAMLAMLAAWGLAACALIPLETPLADLLVQFTAPAFVATAAGTLVLAVMRCRTAAGAGSLAVAALAAAVWPQWFPTTPQPLQNRPEVTVYWSNVWVRNTDIAAMAASVAAASPDIVLMAEVGDVLAANLDVVLPEHPYRVLSVVGKRNTAPARTLVASRWPLHAHPEQTHDRLSAVSATLDTPLGEVGVMASHLTRPWPYEHPAAQVIQTQDMARLRPMLGSRAIIAGDFNSVSSGRIGRQVQHSMQMHPAPGWPGTWPTHLPAFLGITIDQLWHSPSLAVTSRRLGQKNGSDHWPVITRLSLSDPQRP